MTPEQWLNSEIKQRGMTKVFLAQKAGIPKKRLYEALSVRGRIHVDEFLLVCLAAGIRPEDYPVTDEGAARNA